MQKAQGNFERLILICAALLAIATGGWFVRSTFSFPETLVRKEGKEKPFAGEVPVDRIEQATARAASDPQAWNAPIRSNKPVPLFKSVLLLLKNSEPDNIIDMFTETPPIRPPMTNKWLREANLPKIGESAAYLIPNVGELDADGDGFTNLEEFEARHEADGRDVNGTNPIDPKSHPPITDKLTLAERVAHNYRIILRSSSPPFQIATQDAKKKNWFINEGGRFGDGDRFLAGKLEKKVVPDPKLGEKDVSELEVEDTVRKTKFPLILGVETNLADYEAVFDFHLKVQEQVKCMKGESFRIPSAPDTTYKVIDIQEDSAVISPLDSGGNAEKQIIIKRN
jgi:hypothetical protein